MATFGERFHQLRKGKGLTQEQLAQLFYTKKSSISKYEHDKQIPEIEMLEKYADFFGVSVDYLLGRSDLENVDDANKIVKGSPKLAKLLNMLDDREDIRMLLEKIADLEPNDIKRILKIIDIMVTDRS